MALVGYTRGSSVGQSLEVQRDKLKDCEKVFEEQKSGTSDQPPMERAKKQWPDRSSQKKDRHRAVSEAVGLGTAEILGSVS